MPLLHWFSHNIAGWEVFVPAILVFCLPAILCERRGRTDRVPLAFFFSWLLAICLGYVRANLSRFISINPVLWAAMCGTLLVIPLVPLALVQIGATLARRASPNPLRWALGGILALAGLPLTNMVSRVIADIVIPRIRVS